MRPRRHDHRWVEVPEQLSRDVAAMAASLHVHRTHEQITGQKFHYARHAAIATFGSDNANTELQRALSVHRKANRAKHGHDRGARFSATGVSCSSPMCCSTIPPTSGSTMCQSRPPTSGPASFSPSPPTSGTTPGSWSPPADHASSPPKSGSTSCPTKPPTSGATFCSSNSPRLPGPPASGSTYCSPSPPASGLTSSCPNASTSSPFLCSPGPPLSGPPGSRPEPPQLLIAVGSVEACIVAARALGFGLFPSLGDARVADAGHNAQTAPSPLDTSQSSGVTCLAAAANVSRSAGRSRAARSTSVQVDDPLVRPPPSDTGVWVPLSTDTVRRGALLRCVHKTKTSCTKKQCGYLCWNPVPNPHH